jgi:hypothetical protein
MRDHQATGRAAEFRCHFRCHSAAGGLGQIVSKILMHKSFSMLRGRFSRAERRFFPENREMPTVE